jgi:tripartite-type tricarboxylate transporter receptor subunit TctC
MVVPYPPGGVADFLARTLAAKLKVPLRQPIVIENRPGAGTNLGSELVARSPADGYTLLLASSSNLINVSLYSNLKYDPLKDFAAISIVVNVPMMLVVHPSIPAKSVPEFISYAKTHELSYASAGNGSPAHLAAELAPITYRGAPPAVTDLLAGRVPVMFTNLTVVLPHIQAGTLRALGYGGPKRTPALPELPTIAEAGVPDYDSTVWWGVVAPAGTPADVIARLSGEINKALQMDDVQRQFVANGTDPFATSPEQMTEIMQRDLAKWSKVVAISGAKIE